MGGAQQSTPRTPCGEPLKQQVGAPMSQNPIRDFLEACTTRLTWDASPEGDDSVDVVARDATPAEGELARG